MTMACTGLIYLTVKTPLTDVASLGRICFPVITEWSNRYTPVTQNAASMVSLVNAIW